MVAQEPVDPHLLAQLLEVAPSRVEELCDGLRASYEADDRGFVLVGKAKITAPMGRAMNMEVGGIFA